MAKILLVNKFYYRRGGDCTAVLNTEKLLREKGHEVAIFSMQHPENLQSKWETYFPKEIDFSSSGISNKVSAAIRIFHSSEVKKKFEALLADFRPDVVHFHNIHSYLSPLVVEIAHKQGIRTVWTMHDYKLFCPSYTCLSNGQICEACFRQKSKVVTKKCMKDSLAASILGYLEAIYWNREKLSSITDTFISPSSFLKGKMAEAGFTPQQITVLHNFIPHRIIPEKAKDDYYCYAGRISEEKGMDTLLEAAGKLPYKLKVIGGGPFLEKLRRQYESPQIHFLGQLPPKELFPIIGKARFCVLPSIWYENNPFSIIESLCTGTPVLGADIGGIPELIQEGENGFLFTPKNLIDLQEKINRCFTHFTKSYNFQKIADDAQNKFSSETFYNKLMKIYGY